MSDRPTHLSELSICKRAEMTEPSVTVPVWIRQGSLDGMLAVMNFLDGFVAAGKGIPPGYHELWSFYRTLQSCIREAEAEAKKTKEAPP